MKKVSCNTYGILKEFLKLFDNRDDPILTTKGEIQDLLMEYSADIQTFYKLEKKTNKELRGE